MSPRLRGSKNEKRKAFIVDCGAAADPDRLPYPDHRAWDPIPDENGEAAEDQLGQAEQIKDAEDDPAAEGDVRPDADAPTATDPDSDRKTYAEDANAEIVPGADQSLTQKGDGGKTPEHDANGELPAQRMPPPVS